MAGRPLTQLLIKPAGPDCNLHCTYCFYLPKKDLFPATRVHRMSDETLREMIRQMMTSGQRRVGFSWQGGEPTLCGLDFFRRAVEYQKQFGFSGQMVANSLQTNGILIDEEWCRFMAEYKFLVGLSLDGPPDVHNRYRRTVDGRESHERTLRAARMMRKHGVEFNILAVVNDYSARNARRIYQYFREHDFRYLQFIPAVEPDPRSGGPAPFTPSPEAYGDFLCEIFDEWRKDFRDGWPTVSERLFDSLMHTYLGEESPMCIFMETCGDYVVVEHTGDVYSCDFYVEPAWHLGHLSKSRLTALAASPKQVGFGERKRQLPEECRSCRWLQHCNGGCLKDRFAIPATAGSNYLCKGYRQFFQHSEATFLELRDRYLERMSERPEEGPPGSVAAAGASEAAPVDPSLMRRVGRNDPCPCGSGKKFKKCCMKKLSASRPPSP